MTPLVSIVVVSHNSLPYVSSCLRSVYDHPPAQLPFEIVVVDNASTDGTPALIGTLFPDVRLIASPTNDGYGVAVNRAMRVAAGDYLVFLNPDCEVPRGALATMLEFLSASTNAGIVGPRLVLPTGQVQPSGRRFPSPLLVLLEVLRLHKLLPAGWRARHLLGTYWDQSTTRRVDWVSGACHVMARRVWDQVGPVTEKTFCGFDDFEYCLRAARLGFETWLCADATVIHHVGTSVGARWNPSQVDELAINNMFVLLEDLWPSWRIRLLALSEAAAAASDCVTTSVGRHRPADDAVDGKTVRRPARRMALLLALASGRRRPAFRCDPGPTVA